MPIIEISTVTEQLVSEFREKFLKFEGEDLDETTGCPKKFYPDDVEDIKNNDITVKYYLTHGELKVDEAIKIVNTSFSWRKQFGVRNLKFESFADYIKESNAVSIHGTDKESRKILWLYMSRVKRTKTDLNEWNQYLTYHLEKAYQERGDKRLIFVIDLTSVGMTSFDHDLTKFAINLFENYYPDLLTYQLNFNMAWTLKTAWNVIKTFMSAEAISRVKFAKGDEIKQYIDPEFIPQHMGGQFK